MLHSTDSHRADTLAHDGEVRAGAGKQTVTLRTLRWKQPEHKSNLVVDQAPLIGELTFDEDREQATREDRYQATREDRHQASGLKIAEAIKSKSPNLESEPAPPSGSAGDPPASQERDSALEPAVSESKEKASNVDSSKKANAAGAGPDQHTPGEPDSTGGIAGSGEAASKGKGDPPNAEPTGAIATKTPSTEQAGDASGAESSAAGSKPGADQKSSDAGTGAAPKLRLITDPDPPAPKGPPEYHKLQLRLSGSMCYSCLNTMKKKLKQLYGVEKVRIEKPMNNLFQPYAPDVSSWAEAALIYDSNKVELTDLRAFMRYNGYISYKLVDKLLDEPMESFKEGKF